MITCQQDNNDISRSEGPTWVHVWLKPFAHLTITIVTYTIRLIFVFIGEMINPDIDGGLCKWSSRHYHFLIGNIVVSDFAVFLTGLNNSDRIGDLGSRSFFLRKSSSRQSSINGDGDAPEEVEVLNRAPPVVSPQVFFSLIIRRFNKIGRRTRKIWKVLGCMSCSWYCYFLFFLLFSNLKKLFDKFLSLPYQIE